MTAPLYTESYYLPLSADLSEGKTHTLDLVVLFLLLDVVGSRYVHLKINKAREAIFSPLGIIIGRDRLSVYCVGLVLAERELGALELFVCG